MNTLLRLFLVSLSAAAAVVLVCSAVAAAGSFPLIICGTSARNPGDGLSWSHNSPLVSGPPTCPAAGLGLSIYTQSNQTAGHNATGAFAVNAPAGITIYSIHVVNAQSFGIGKNGWWGEFYWNGGPGPAGRSGPLNDGQFDAGGCCSQTNLQSRTIGWFIACNQATCKTGNGVGRHMTELDLVAEEDQAPSIVASGAGNLWYQNSWGPRYMASVFHSLRFVRGVRGGRGVRHAAGDQHTDSGHCTEPAYMASVSRPERPCHCGHDRVRRQPRTG